jgi:hypothetical protein
MWFKEEKFLFIYFSICVSKVFFLFCFVFMADFNFFQGF